MNQPSFVRLLSLALTLKALTLATFGHPKPDTIRLSQIGTYESGIFNAGGAEIVAHDPATQRLFVVNAQDAKVDVLSIVDPSCPTKVASIDVKPFGAVANSVAVFDRLIAVAVEAPVKTDPGQVVFFNRHLNFLKAFRAGALPDMLTFSPDGRYVLVANEGEPNDAYTIDPEGSVTIIDLDEGIRHATVRTVDFKAFNGAKLDPSIRIFGPNASVAQDLEPEYVTISDDSKTAWVTCQENNAIAVIDIKSAKVTKLIPLGFKDHGFVDASAQIYSVDPDLLPSIGSTLAGQELFLGGCSGLFFEGINPDTGRLKFVTHTDRGPNTEPTGILRPFLLPEFTPAIIRFEFDRESGEIVGTQWLPLQTAPNVPLTGLPNTAIDSSPNTPYNDEVPVDLLGAILPLDALGADLEGIVVDPQDGSFWMVDEYRPAIYHFDSEGILIDRFIPSGTAAAAGELPGVLGEEVLPAVLAQRRQNRGFEGVAFDAGKVYAFVQSPLRNPASLGNAALNAMRNIRVVEFDPATKTTRQFLYIMDNADLGAGSNSRADKIGDAVSLGNGEFLVIERDDDAVPDDAPALIEKRIYRCNLAGATDVTGKDGLFDVGAGVMKSIDQMTIAELLVQGIRPLDKILHVDLNQVGYNQVEKVEGLAVIDPWTLAVINDNDFGVANITVNPDGSFVVNAQPDPIQLGIIDVRLNGLDASDQDTKINIRQWPVKGMYLPDGIDSYKVGGQTFLVTANEGDVREYAGFNEAVRIGANGVNLDPAIFANAAVLKNSANLGRLTITTTKGKNSTGQFEELYSFGTRSFSIWTSGGQLVFDSGDDLEQITALEYPANFNASNSNNTFDNRSDDKGPEPEGVVIGIAYGRTYAFIGLERIGGVVVYNIDNPYEPVFVDYINFRDFNAAPDSGSAGDLGPEGLVFIEAQDSPNGKPLLVMGNEISGTTTIFEVRRAK